MMIDKISFVCLFLSPLYFLIFNPYIDAQNSITVFFILSVLILTLTLFATIVDVFRFGIPSMFLMFGYDVKDKKAREFFREMFKKNI